VDTSVKSIRVLLVDDHRMFAQGVALILDGEADVEIVGIAGTGHEALGLFEREQPDVVLMDIDIPGGMDGLDTTRRLIEAWPSARVLVLSALRQPDIVSRAVDAGAIAFVSKIEAVEDLVALVRRAAADEMVRAVDGLSFYQDQGAISRTLGSHRRLTPREVDVLQAIAEGRTTSEVARYLYISQFTVQTHVKSILAKMEARSKLEAVIRALKLGLIRVA
jgi:DNA-binding NarL/FixJ family response regulator